jgi:hypothetical protein
MREMGAVQSLMASKTSRSVRHLSVRADAVISVAVVHASEITVTWSVGQPNRAWDNGCRFVEYGDRHCR